MCFNRNQINIFKTFCLFPRVHREEFPIRVSVLIFKNGLPIMGFQEINQFRSQFFSLGDFKASRHLKHILFTILVLNLGKLSLKNLKIFQLRKIT
jgi:hypothetical protein